MMGQQLITPQQGLMLLDFPDLEAITGDNNAALKNIEEKLASVQRNGDKPESMPHPYLQLDVAWKLAIDRINRLESEHAPRPMVEAMIRWAEDVKALRDAAQPPPPAPPPPESQQAMAA